MNVFETSETISPPVRRWIEINKKIFERIDVAVRNNFPVLWNRYNQIKLPGDRYFGFAPSLAVSFGPSAPHKDKDDLANGLCFVMPFGHFHGGHLKFNDINIEVDLHPGQLACFQSAKLTHSNTDVEGDRMSLVLFAHSALFFPGTKE